MNDFDINKIMERTKLMTEFVDWAMQDIHAFPHTKEEFTIRLGKFVEEYTFGK